jgi:DnaJ-class molecular chaperone
VYFKKEIDAAAKTLGLELENLTAERLKGAYLERAKATHPDAGGAPEDFKEVALAFKCLSDWMRARETAPACPRCGGSGYYTKRKGFSELKVLCSCKRRGEKGDIAGGV